MLQLDHKLVSTQYTKKYFVQNFVAVMKGSVKNKSHSKVSHSNHPPNIKVCRHPHLESVIMVSGHFERSK